MTQGHKGSILPQKGGVSPIDSNTVFYAPYDDGVRDVVKGINPIGSTRSLSLSGNSTSHVSINNSSFLSTGNTSIAMWVNPTSWTHTAHAAILSTRPNTSNGIMIFKLSGTSTINIDYGGSAQRFDTGYLPPLNKWTHIAYTHDGTTGYFYVNGILHRTTILGSAVNASNGKEMKIGTDLVDLTYAYKGEIYDVIIANKVFTKEEIARIMTQPDTVNGFSARWLLNENDGIIAYDYSGGGNDGIISNGNWANGVLSYSFVNESIGRALLIEEETTNLINPNGFAGDANFKIEKLDEYTFKVTLMAIPPTNGYYVQQVAPVILANKPATMSVEVLEMSNPTWAIGISGWGMITGADGFKIGSRHIRTITHTTDWPYSISLGYVGDMNRTSLKIGDYIIARNAQIEQKGFATSFVNGTRPKASLSYSKELINPAVFTLSAWVKLNVMPSKAGLVPSGLAPIFEISNGIVGTNRLLFGWLASNELVVWRSNLVGAENSGLRTSSIFNSTDVGVWRFYAATFDGTTYKVYVDGKLVGSMRMSPATYHPSSNLGIGGGLHGTLNGSIDEVRIDKVARTLEEIQAWYYQGRSGG